MLEDDLRALVSQSPSPEFEARVRMRIAAQPAPHGWATSWRLAFAAAAAAAVVALVYSAVRTPMDVTPAAASLLDARAALTYVPHADAVRPAAIVGPPRESRRAIIEERTVILNRAERLALQRLFASPSVFVTLNAEPVQTEAGLPAPIEIPELSIAPLAIEEVKGEPHDR